MANVVKGTMAGVTGGYTTSDGELNFKTTVVYRVESDQVTVDSTYILATAGLPIVRSSFLTLANGLIAVCKSKKAKQDTSNRKIWLVTCEFDTEAFKESEEDGSEEQQTGDPTGWVPRVSVGFEEFAEIHAEDVTGDPYINSAGEPFATGLEIKRYVWVWNFTQYEAASQSFETISARVGKVNGATWRGYAAKTWLCLVRNAELGKKNGYDAWKIDYTLKYKESTWIHKTLDVGSYYLSSGDKLPFKDKYENRVIGTLNGSGAEETTAADVAILEFDRYETTDFGFIRVG
jgi:hypothetical protein